MKHSFIEQSPETKRYRLGHGFLRLARIREATVPVSHIAKDVVDWLVDLTNETVHASVPGPQGMTTIAHKLPNRGRVVNIVPARRRKPPTASCRWSVRRSPRKPSRRRRN